MGPRGGDPPFIYTDIAGGWISQSCGAPAWSASFDHVFGSCVCYVPLVRRMFRTYRVYGDFVLLLALRLVLGRLLFGCFVFSFRARHAARFSKLTMF